MSAANSPVAKLTALRERIAQAAARAGRDAAGICLIGVSKFHGTALVRPLVAAGHFDYGENRVQEAQAKWPPLKMQFPRIRLHLVGTLQTNKVRDALGLFDFIHSLDRPRLARKLAEVRDGGNAVPRLFIQVNTGEEPQKSGVVPGEADAFIRLCRDELRLPVVGLMCVPPVDEEPALHFALLAKLARRNDLSGLSMGMSEDFETAIAFGATHIRVGTALFGPRPSTLTATASPN